MSEFGHCTPKLRAKLFETYCMSLYGAELWNFCDNSTYKMHTGYRKCARRVLGIDNRTHCHLIPYILHTIPFEVKLHRRFINFFFRCMTSTNVIVNNIARRSIHSNSICGRNIRFICPIYKIDFKSLKNATRRPPVQFSTNSDYKFNGDLISSLLEYSYDPSLSIPDRDNLRFMIDYLCLN